MVGEHLAFTGAVKDQVVDTEHLACRLIQLLSREYPDRLKERYGLESLDMESYELLEQIARKRGMLISGGEADTERASIAVLDEFRGGKLGRISLETPERMGE